MISKQAQQQQMTQNQTRAPSWCWTDAYTPDKGQAHCNMGQCTNLGNHQRVLEIEAGLNCTGVTVSISRA